MLEEELVSREYSEGGTGQHGNYGRPSRQVATMGPTLGLAYRMTGEKRYAEKLRQALIHHDKVVLDSLSKVYTVFTPGDPEFEVALQGQPVIKATLRTVTEPRRTRLNGKATNATYDKSSRTVTLLRDSR